MFVSLLLLPFSRLQKSRSYSLITVVELLIAVFEQNHTAQSVQSSAVWSVAVVGL